MVDSFRVPFSIPQPKCQSVTAFSIKKDRCTLLRQLQPFPRVCHWSPWRPRWWCFKIKAGCNWCNGVFLATSLILNVEFERDSTINSGDLAHLHEHQSFMIWPGTDHCSFKSQDWRGWAKHQALQGSKDHQRFRKELDHQSLPSVACRLALTAHTSPPPSLGDDMTRARGQEGEVELTIRPIHYISLLYDYLTYIFIQWLPSVSSESCFTLLQVLVDFSDGVLRGTFSPWAEWRASLPNFVQIWHWYVVNN